METKSSNLETTSQSTQRFNLRDRLFIVGSLTEQVLTISAIRFGNTKVKMSNLNIFVLFFDS